ncbi:MAG: sugar phosphate isomerase/epimerase [Lachnospiraceae bacterium]|jgi:sugar phosphate isomerase/epimerase|nr:sugar phosphate isomerase/epimerase [Lachnospiraceae bacterium]
MQIGLRLHDSINLPLPERLKAVKEQGFSCVHLALGKLPGESSEPAALTPGYAMYLRRAFDEAGLDIAVLGNYLNLAHPDPEAMEKILKKYEAHLRFASLLGCGMVGTETGAPNRMYQYNKKTCHSRKALLGFLENLKRVVEMAEKTGVILAIEPVYRHIVWNPEVAREVLDKVDSPNLQIIFDPVNLLHGDNLDLRHEVIRQAIDLLGDDIAMIHLKDYVPAKDGSKELTACACGTGEMDYRAVLSFAKKKKPHIQATLENTTPENAVTARKYIEKIYNGDLL